MLEEIGFADIRTVESPVVAEADADMLATIGLVGAARGHFVLRFDSASAIAFVAKLSSCLGMEGNDPRDPRFRKEALGEIANQIGGRAIALLAEIGLDCMITPPTIIAGVAVNAVLPESDDKSAFTVAGGFGEFRCVLALKRSKAI